MAEESLKVISTIHRSYNRYNKFTLFKTTKAS